LYRFYLGGPRKAKYFLGPPSENKKITALKNPKIPNLNLGEIDAPAHL